MPTIHYEVAKTSLSIYIDDELWREVSTAIISPKTPLPQSCENHSQFLKLYAELEHKGAKLYTYKRLARQNLSSADLMRLLSLKGVSPEIAAQVVNEMQNLGYVNDDSWAEAFIRQQRQLKKGRLFIASKLRRKGFSTEQVDAWLSEQHQDYSEDAAIRKLLSTKYHKRNLQDFKEKNKVIASLVRKGFSLNDVLKALDTT